MPFEVPSSWVWTTLGEIGNWQSGATPSRLRKDYYGGNIPWLKTGDLNDGYISDIPEYITETALKETSVKLNPKDSVLIAMYGATIGKVGILSFPATTNQACCACTDYLVKKMYLFYFLLANRKKFIAMGGGGAQPNISKEKIVSTLIPLPPKQEQSRIVEGIEHWLSLVDCIEKNKDNLQRTIKEAKSKVLDLAIHGKLVPQDPTDEPAAELLKRINPKAEITSDNGHYQKLPKGWCLCDLSSLCKIKGGKRIPRGRTFSKERTPHIYIRVSDMKNNTIITTDLKYIDDDVYQTIKNYTISSSDLYLTIAGTIGHVGIVPKQFDGMNLTENAAKLTGIICDKKYLLYSLLSSTAQEHFKSRFHQVAQPKLSIETASSTMIYLPPLKEQHRIVSQIEEIFAQLDTIEASL